MNVEINFGVEYCHNSTVDPGFKPEPDASVEAPSRTDPAARFNSNVSTFGKVVNW